MSNNKVHYAFPHEDGQFEGENDAGSHGMTLRDYFAAKFAAASISDSTLVAALVEYGTPDGMSFNRAVSERAYKLADAMLEARDK